MRPSTRLIRRLPHHLLPQKAISCKRKYIWMDKTLTIGEVSDFMTKKEGGMEEAE